MDVRGISFEQVQAIVARESDLRYGGNVRLHADARPLHANAMRGRIDVHDSKGPGARRSASGRRGPYACWHAYRDMLRAIFAEAPNARVKTGMARYEGSEGFEDTYPHTANINIGSMFAPAYMPELCECDDSE